MAEESGTATESQSAPADAREKVQESAGNVKSKAQSAVRDQVDQRSTQAGERVGSVAGDLRSVSEELRNKDNEPGAKIAEQVADRAEQAGDYLKDADADRLLHDVEDLGRRQPWVVLAGGVALGLVAARFLKASSSERYQSRSGNGSNGSSAGGLSSGSGTTASGGSDAAKAAISAPTSDDLQSAEKPVGQPAPALGPQG
jgi:hypothetical protein